MEVQNASRLLEAEPAGSLGIVADESLERASQPFVGQWNRLVSTTNWEKGRIISRWRQALKNDGAPAAVYSDEAWAERVGGVSGQHVGRLRRVFDRFGRVYEEYTGLYWSHFHAALDWDDAELWLEGAVQSGWSVAQMRRQRWDASGGGAEEPIEEPETLAGEIDEDFQPPPEQEHAAAGRAALAPQEAPPPEGTEFTGPAAGELAKSGAAEPVEAEEPPTEAIQFVRPFENLAELPEDLADAFEHFKLTLLRHKTEGWSQISRDDVLAALDALKQLALAPSLD